MGIFDFFRRKKSEVSEEAETKRTPVEVIQQALANQGVEADESEVKAAINSVTSKMKFVPTLPEALQSSNSAELSFNGSDYVVNVSMALMGGAGDLSDYAMNTILSCAVYWTSASEIAHAKGVSDLCLKKDDVIAIMDQPQFMRASNTLGIYRLFPELLDKQV